jgi:hypothetical protein
MTNPESADDAKPGSRANQVVERFWSSGLAHRMGEEDWVQVRNQLETAYEAIDQAQLVEQHRRRIRWAFSLLVAFAASVCIQWRLDAHWSIHGPSTRTIILPVIMIVQVPAIVIVVLALVWIGSELVSRERDAGFVLFLLLGSAILCGFWTLITTLTVFLFHYSWMRATIIAIAEPIAWVLVFFAVLRVFEVVISTVKADPRAELVADLAALLGVAAVKLSPDTPALSLREFLERSAENAKDKQDGLDAQPASRDISKALSDWRQQQKKSQDPLPRILHFSRGAWNWREDRRMRTLLADRLGRAADNIESRLPKLTGSKEAAVRSSVRARSSKIAVTLRRYASDLILGGVEHDEQLPNRLISTLVAASWGRWDTLAAKDAAPAVERFINRLGWRIVAAAVLVAGGILVPIWFHGLVGDASAQFRVALFTLAVLTVTEPPKAAVEKLTHYAESAVGLSREKK